ncbi:retrovirus-related pol polyprotein from transposon TNT 1-94 [Tanacetum coccineum]
MACVSKSISIPNEEFSDDTSPSVARKFLNEVKSTITTLQCVVRQKMTLDIHNWSSTIHQELHKIVKDEKFPIVNQVDARLQNFKIQFLKEAAKFVRDFKSLANEADESLAKHKPLEFEIERLLRAVVSQDILLIVQCNAVVDTSNLQTELERTKERFENSYNDMKQKIERLQAQLGDFKENEHLKTTYKNLFDSINVTRAQTKTITDSLQQKLHDTIYENAKLRGQLFDKVSEQKDTTKGTSTNTNFENQSTKRKLSLQSLRNNFVVRQPNAFQSQRQFFLKTQVPPKVVETNDLSNLVTSNSLPITRESKVMKNDNVIAPRMFRINPFKTYREEKFVPINQAKTSVRKNLITVSKPHVITKKDVNTDSNGLSSTRVDNTAKTRRPHPRSNTKNDRVSYASKISCLKNKKVENDKSEVVYAMCKLCLITSNHDVCVLKKHKPKGKKPKKVGAKEILASPKPRKPRTCLRWSPIGHMFDLIGKIIESSESESQSDCFKGHSNLFMFLGTLRFGNDHIAAILGYGDLQWGNILITRVYFVDGLGHNLFSVGQFCDSDLEVAFRRNTCLVRNLEGVDLLKENCTPNFYTINLHEMAFASPIFLMARATSTKSWLWHQRLSHLNFDTINDLAKNDLVTGLPKIKYHKEHLCPSCEQEKRKKASHPPKPVPNSKQRLHLLHMDLYGPMRVKSINRKRYVLVIVDDYYRYTWVHFIRSKDEAPKEIKTFLKKITVLLQAPVIIVRTGNGTEFKNQVLKEYFDSVGISHQASFVRTPQQNGVVECRNQTLVEATRTMLIFSRAPLFLWNNREDIGKLGAKGDIGFFIGYSANSCAYRVYNRRTKKIMETMNVTFDELSAMDFEQHSSKPRLQSMTSG